MILGIMRRKVLKRAILFYVLALLAGLAVFYMHKTLLAAYSAYQRVNVVYTADDAGNKAALTFDVSEVGQVWPIVVVLNEEGVRGTFFVDEREILRNPAIIKMLQQKEMETGILVKGYPAANNQQAAIEAKFIRPVKGSYSDLKEAKKHYSDMVLWSIDGGWAQPAQGTVKRIISQVRSGDIIRFDAASPEVPGAVRKLLGEMSNKNLQAVTISELFAGE